MGDLSIQGGALALRCSLTPRETKSTAVRLRDSPRKEKITRVTILSACVPNPYHARPCCVVTQIPGGRHYDCCYYCPFTEQQNEASRDREQPKAAWLQLKERASHADVLPHRGPKICPVRKPFNLLKAIKIRIAFLNPNNIYSESGFQMTREGG